MGTRREPRDLGELRRAVQQLGEEPDEWPYYVKSPTAPGVAPGWWWTPAGGEPTYLGANVFLALRALPNE